MSGVDILAIGPHPDDIEIGVGGIIAKSVAQGMSVALLDLTEGELGTRGSVDERRKEAEAAAKILGAQVRVNAKLPDGGLANVPEQRRAVIDAVRDLRPRLVLAPLNNDRHPDHEAAHFLARDSVYLAGLKKIETGREAFRPSAVYYYRVYSDPESPNFVVDISAHWETKENALRAYQSQLYNPNYEGAETFVSSQAFWEGIRTRAQYWGQRVGCGYGEPLYALGPVAVDFPPGWN